MRVLLIKTQIETVLGALFNRLENYCGYEIAFLLMV